MSKIFLAATAFVLVFPVKAYAHHDHTPHLSIELGLLVMAALVFTIWGRKRLKLAAAESSK